MPPETLANRVAILEQKMLSLDGLPDRVASLEVQIVQFRAEVRAEFSAVREEMRAEIRAGDEETRCKCECCTRKSLPASHSWTNI
jgi:hypothetical protein